MEKPIIILPPIVICESAPYLSLSAAMRPDGIRWVLEGQNCPYCNLPLADHSKLIPPGSIWGPNTGRIFPR